MIQYYYKFDTFDIEQFKKDITLNELENINNHIIIYKGIKEICRFLQTKEEVYKIYLKSKERI